MRILLVALFALLLAPSDSFEGLRSEWVQDLHQKRIEASVALYAPDGVFIQPDGARIEGTAALRGLFNNITSTFDSDLQFSSQRVQISGDLAFDSGTYTEKLVDRATGNHLHSKGSYLTIYRRQPDGSWKILEQVWTGAIESSQPH